MANPLIRLTQYREAMVQANELIHAFRNEPETVNGNNARYVDPVIRNLRVAINEIEQILQGETA